MEFYGEGLFKPPDQTDRSLGDRKWSAHVGIFVRSYISYILFITSQRFAVPVSFAREPQ